MKPEQLKEIITSWHIREDLAELIAKDILNTEPEDAPNIKEACLEHWHNEEYAWAYVECDCTACKEARKIIALRKYKEYICIYGMPMNERAMSFWDWLQQEDK